MTYPLRTVFFAVWRLDKAPGRTAPTVEEGTAAELAFEARTSGVPADLHLGSELHYVGEVFVDGSTRWGPV